MNLALSPVARQGLMRQFALELDTKDGDPVVKIVGQFTSQHINEFRTLLDEVAAQHTSERLYIDMESLSFIDSLGIGVLIFYYNHLRRNGVEITLYRPSPAIEEILRLTSLDRVIPVER